MFRDVWLGNLKDAPLKELLELRGSEYWENFVQALENRRASLGYNFLFPALTRDYKGRVVNVSCLHNHCPSEPARRARCLLSHIPARPNTWICRLARSLDSALDLPCVSGMSLFGDKIAPCSALPTILYQRMGTIILGPRGAFSSESRSGRKRTSEGEMDS